MSKFNEDRKLFINYLKLSRPKDDLYKTVSKKKPFSQEYSIKVPYSLYMRSAPSVVGTAFDYLARFMIARTININKDHALLNLRAENGIDFFNEDYQDELYDKFEICMDQIEHYINGSNEINLVEVTKICCFLARLEHASRTNWVPNEETLKLLKKEDSEILKEVNSMGVVFYDDFIAKGMVKEDSVVVFNPSFGICSKKLKGADGDIFIDGVLWDFKTTKLSIKKSNDFIQMWQYLVYDRACKMYNDSTYSLAKHEIKALAFYKARFGEIEYIKVRDINAKQLYAVSRTIVEMIPSINQNLTIDEALNKTKRVKIFNK